MANDFFKKLTETIGSVPKSPFSATSPTGERITIDAGEVDKYRAQGYNLGGGFSYLDAPEIKGAIGSLGTQFGYSPELSSAIITQLSPHAPAGQASQATPFTAAGYGNFYDIEKNFGGVTKLAEFLAAGGNAVPTQSAARGFEGKGGTQSILAPEGGAVIKEGQMTRADAIQQLLQSTGKEPTEEQITALVGTKAGTQAGGTDGKAIDPNVANIQKVFGPNWKPSPKFTPELQSRGIYGAVRIDGTNEVYALGPGGGYLSADAYKNLFGTTDQKGIVGQITVAQAKALGIQTVGAGLPGEEIPETGTGAGGAGVIGGATGGGLPDEGEPTTYKDFLKKFMTDWQAQQDLLKGIDEQIFEVEDLLSGLEENINTRIQEMGGVMTEAQRQRTLAIEGKDPRERYSELLTERSRAQSGISEQRDFLGLAKEAYAPEAETPREKFERELAEDIEREQAMVDQGFKLKPTAKATTTPTTKTTPTTPKEQVAKNQFTKTQINKGASAAGMTIDKFSNLSVEEANEYINGIKKDFKGGRLPEKTIDEYKTFIIEAVDSGSDIEKLMDAVAKNQVPNIDIPAKDRQLLLNWMEEKYPVKVRVAGKTPFKAGR